MFRIHHKALFFWSKTIKIVLAQSNRPSASHRSTNISIIGPNGTGRTKGAPEVTRSMISSVSTVVAITALAGGALLPGGILVNSALILSKFASPAVHKNKQKMLLKTPQILLQQITYHD
jgi:hypothetical protein